MAALLTVFVFNGRMLWLASASPARRRLLEQAAIPHRVQVSGVDEDAITDPDPRRLVQLLARAKARAVQAARAATALADTAPGPILGCDSVLAFEGEVFGKPADAAEAIARWQRMAGGWGELHTGHCLLLPAAVLLAPDRGPGEGLDVAGPDGEYRDGGGLAGEGLEGERLETVTTRVQFAALSSAEISAYVATGEPLQCAGGFALEGRGGLVVERIEGCFSNVIGLSLPLLRRWLS